MSKTIRYTDEFKQDAVAQVVRVVMLPRVNLEGWLDG